MSTDRHSKMVESAVWLAEQGFADIGWAPVSDGKAPKRKWKSDATDDPAMVRKMLQGAVNALVIPKGKAAIIDVDDPAAAVALAGAGMPPGFRVTSPTPGHGHFYVYQNGTELPTSFAGGEIRRGGSGMVLGPWALRSDGVYTPNAVHILPELPHAVAALLVAMRREKQEREGKARGPDDDGWFIVEPGRHEFLKSRARHLRGVGMSGERLRDELRRLNTERCRPPKSEEEVDDIADWTNETIDDDPPKDYAPGATIGTRTAGDLRHGLPPDQLAGPFLTPEGPTIVYGPGGVGKGTIACWLILGLVRAGYIVMILDYEGHEREWGSRLRGLGATDTELAAIHYRAPFSPDWTAKTGALSEVAPAVRADCERLTATYLVVDSYSVATSNGDTMGGEQAAREYFSALSRIGLPSLTIAHVRGDAGRFPDRPFGSVFVHNFARETWAAEAVGDRDPETSPDLIKFGPSVVSLELRNQKANGRAKSSAQFVTFSYFDDASIEVNTDRLGRSIADLAADVLREEPLPLAKIAKAIKEDTGQKVTEDALRVTMKRDPTRFSEAGTGRPRLWSVR